jgi:hypothetical protein
MAGVNDKRPHKLSDPDRIMHCTGAFDSCRDNAASFTPVPSTGDKADYT